MIMYKQPYKGQHGDVYHPAPTTNMFFHSEFASERGSIAKSEFAEPAKDVRPRPHSIISMD